METLGMILFDILLFGIPLGVIVWFLVSLVLYRKRDRSNTEQVKRRKLSLILSATVLGVMAATVIALMTLISISIAHM